MNRQYSLSLYTAHAVLAKTFFWTPVFVLYFSSMVTLENVFLLEAVYYASAFTTEVPSGYVSDAFGRRRTLLLSGLFLCISYTLFVLSTAFAMLAAAQVFLAMGFSFASGTDTSLHFALLQKAGKDSEYGRREARIASLTLVFGATASLTGGAMAWWGSYRRAYGLSLMFALVSLGLMLFIRDPEEGKREEKAAAPLNQMKGVADLLKKPELAYLFGFSVLIVILNHVPYELYQPYAESLGRTAAEKSAAPLLTGGHAAITQLLAAALAAVSIRLRRVLGLKGLLLTAILLQTSLMGLLAIPGSSLIFALLMLRGIPGPLTLPAVRAEMTPLLPTGKRATFLSVQSLAGRLGFAVLLTVFNRLPGEGIRPPALAGALIGLAGILVFAALQPKYLS